MVDIGPQWAGGVKRPRAGSNPAYNEFAIFKHIWVKTPPRITARAPGLASVLKYGCSRQGFETLSYQLYFSYLVRFRMTYFR